MTRMDEIRLSFQAITKRRLITLVAIRPDEYEIVENWILDVQLNMLPMAMFNADPLYALWLTIESTPAIKEFLYGVCFEFRTRAFHHVDDWELFLATLTTGASQFFHPSSLMSDEAIAGFQSTENTHAMLTANPWVIPLVLFEQHTPEELGMTIAGSNLENARANRG